MQNKGVLLFKGSFCTRETRIKFSKVCNETLQWFSSESWTGQKTVCKYCPVTLFQEPYKISRAMHLKLIGAHFFPLACRTWAPYMSPRPTGTTFWWPRRASWWIFWSHSGWCTETFGTAAEWEASSLSAVSEICCVLLLSRVTVISRACFIFGQKETPYLLSNRINLLLDLIRKTNLATRQDLRMFGRGTHTHRHMEIIGSWLTMYCTFQVACFQIFMILLHQTSVQ